MRVRVTSAASFLQAKLMDALLDLGLGPAVPVPAVRAQVSSAGPTTREGDLVKANTGSPRRGA